MNNENSNLKILIVEDDYLVSVQIIETLTQLGYKNIVEASNGLEAIDVVKATRPDIIFMDLEMPEMDGIKASLEIQAKYPTPIVILTAYENRELLNDASNAGVAAYLVKPLKKDLVEKVIIIALARHNDLIKMKNLNLKLQKTLDEIKTLKGILPICSECQNIKDENNNWIEIQQYITTHTEAELTHSLCPHCAESLFGEQDWYKRMKSKKNREIR